MSEPTPVGSRQILVLAAWAGLVAGVLESLTGIVLQAVGRPVRVPVEILWIAPVVDFVLFLAAGAVLAALARLPVLVSRARISLVALLWMLAFGLIQVPDVMAPVAALVLALGLAMVVSRGSGAFDRWHRLARRTLVLFAVAACLCASAGFAWSPWRDGNLVAALPAADAGLPNVLLVTLDTLRADHVSAYGYSRATTPRLDALARTGVLFESAFSNSSWTLPSHASLLTGRYPHEHGADWVQPMKAGVPTLAEVLASSGYQTAAFAANTSYVAPEWGLGRGFSHFEVHGASLADDVVRTAYGHRLALNVLPRLGEFDIPGRKHAADLNASFLTWLDGVKRRPFFALLNYLDVHDPYLTEAPYRTQFSPGPARGDVINFQFQPHAFRRKTTVTTEEAQAEIDAYDGCLASLDVHIGRLFDELSRRGLDRNTIVVITSDHGESFGGHGLFGHGNSAYIETLHVPLIVIWPGHVPANVRVSQVVGLDRLPATIGGLIGHDAGTWPLPGRSLAPLWATAGPKGAAESVAVLSEVTGVDGGPSGYPTSSGSLTSLLTADWHLIVSSSGAAELYAWRSDRDERADLASGSEGRAAIGEFEEPHAAIDDGEKAMTAPRDHRARAGIYYWLAAIATALTCATIVIVHRESFRTLVSAHGLLHSAIAQEFTSGAPFGRPENPFFAGEPLPYYWFYHYVAARLGALAGVHPLVAFEAIGLVAVALVWFAGAELGRRLGWGPGPSLAISFFALAGANAFGSVFLLAKLASGRPWPADDSAYLWGLTHPVMGMIRWNDPGALYGPLINFFLNVSSRPVALSLMLVGVVPLMRYLQGGPAAPLVAIVVVSASCTALSPIIGLLAALALSGALACDWMLTRSRRSLASAAALLAGCALPALTYYHLFGRSQVPGIVLGLRPGLVATLMVAGGPLLFLACIGVIRRSSHRRVLAIVGAAGAALMLGNALVLLPSGNDSNLFHVAAFLLAVPAAGALAGGAAPLATRYRVAVLGLLLVCFSTSALVVRAYWNRPPVDLVLDGSRLRLGRIDSARALAYEWIRSKAPSNAVFVVDESLLRATVLGNVPELPALTGRALFVSADPDYMVNLYPETVRRRQITARLLAGEPLAEADARYVAALARPVLAVVEDDGSDRLVRLQQAGPAVFRQESLAIFLVALPRSPEGR